MNSRKGFFSQISELWKRRSRSPLGEEELKMMIGAICSTNDHELTCDECQEELDAFAEQVLAGKDPAEAIPLVHAHLQMCGECREEFEALLEALNAHEKKERNE